MEEHKASNNGDSDSKSNLERYFHVSYLYKNNTGCSVGYGSIPMVTISFMLTKESIVSKVVEIYPDIQIRSIVVMGITEFKNELEYKQFYGYDKENTEG